MPTSTTLTLRLNPAVKQQLGRLADATHRTKSFLAAEAIAAYVTREADVIAGIERGLEDMRAERVVPHDDAMSRLRATAAKAKQSAARRARD
jgi:predicted transcriptional regulator